MGCVDDFQSESWSNGTLGLLKSGEKVSLCFNELCARLGDC